MQKNSLRLYGLLFFLLSMVGICAVLYGATQPWWKNIGDRFATIFNVPASVRLERYGVFLQLLAGLSIIPELIGDKNLRNYESSLNDFYSNIKGINIITSWFTDKTIQPSNKLERRFVLTATILWIAAILLLWLYPIFSSSPEFANVKKGLLSCVMILILGTAGVIGPLMAEVAVFVVRGVTVWSLKMLPIKRLVSFVSFPLFLIGTLLQLAATFLT